VSAQLANLIEAGGGSPEDRAGIVRELPAIYEGKRDEKRLMPRSAIAVATSGIPQSIATPRIASFGLSKSGNLRPGRAYR
jgi:hypothetical protein